MSCKNLRKVQHWSTTSCAHAPLDSARGAYAFQLGSTARPDASHLAGCISAASVLARLCLQLDLDLAWSCGLFRLATWMPHLPHIPAFELLRQYCVRHAPHCIKRMSDDELPAHATAAGKSACTLVCCNQSVLLHVEQSLGVPSYITHPDPATVPAARSCTQLEPYCS
jgi:hypothetical protein